VARRCGHKVGGSKLSNWDPTIISWCNDREFGGGRHQFRTIQVAAKDLPRALR